MSKILEYIDQDNCFLVVENKSNKNQYCFKFDRKPNSNFWFVSAQHGTWQEKRYQSIATISLNNGIHTAKANKLLDCDFQAHFFCLRWLFENCQDNEQMKRINLVYGKINLV